MSCSSATVYDVLSLFLLLSEANPLPTALNVCVIPHVKPGHFMIIAKGSERKGDIRYILALYMPHVLVLIVNLK